MAPATQLERQGPGGPGGIKLNTRWWWVRAIQVAWAVSGQVLSAGRGRWFLPSAQHWGGHTWQTVSRSGLPSTERRGATGERPAEGLKDVKGLGHLSWEERLTLGLLGLEKLREGAMRLCSVVAPDRRRHDRHKEEHRRFLLNTRKRFTVWVTEHWHRLPRGVVESPTLEILKSCLDMVLGNLL